MNQTYINHMNKLIIAALFAGASTLAAAENTSAKPHDQHPDSSKQGDYLKDQPSDSNMEKTHDAGTMNKDSMNKDGTQKGNLEKGKSHKEKPAAGGVDVNGKY